MSISREVDHDNSFLGTDMENQTISNLRQGIPKRMWLPQSISSDVGGELREIGGGGSALLKKFLGKALISRKERPKSPKFWNCRNPQKDENKEGNSKYSMGKEHVPVLTQKEIKEKEGNSDPLFDEGGSPVFGNLVHLGNKSYLQTYAQKKVSVRDSYSDGSGNNIHSPSIPFPCPMQTEGETPQPPPHHFSLSDNPNPFLRKRKKWARQSCLTNLSDKKELSPSKRKHKDIDVATQSANPKKSKSLDAVTIQNEPLPPSYSAAVATQLLPNMNN
ncbi:hypothetical protein U1Q18_004445 [Sarracenia purpurea var. burkii]